MVEDLDKAGRGRAAGGAARFNFDTALEGWRVAPEDKKEEDDEDDELLEDV